MSEGRKLNLPADIGERINSMLQDANPDVEFHFTLVAAADATPIQTISNLCPEHCFGMLSQLMQVMANELGLLDVVEFVEMPDKSELN